jgi:hypothetical protein
MITMAVPMVRGAVSGDWSTRAAMRARKHGILQLWDEGVQEQLKRAVALRFPPQRFQETITAFGQYKDVLHNRILYVIDNEVTSPRSGLRVPARVADRAAGLLRPELRGTWAERRG